MEASYLFELNYGNRTKEKEFIGEILDRYETQLSLAMICINNNPYNFEFYLHIYFKDIPEDFENWMQTKFNSYFLNSRRFNFFLKDFLNSLPGRGYNVTHLYIRDMLDYQITKEPNLFFSFYDSEYYNSIYKGGLKEMADREKVFISHSSIDKEIVEKIFNLLQKKEIPAFYDKREIYPTDNIREIINSNLKKSKAGIICVSKNFNTEESDWLRYEVEYFKSQNVIIVPVNIDLSKEEIKKIVGDIRYLNLEDVFQTDNEELINILKKSLRK